MKKFIIINWGPILWLNQVIESFIPFKEEVELAIFVGQSNLEHLLQGVLPPWVYVFANQMSSEKLKAETDGLIDRNINLILNEKVLILGYCFSPQAAEVNKLVEKVISEEMAGLILDEASEPAILHAARMLFEHRKNKTEQLVQSGN